MYNEYQGLMCPTKSHLLIYINSKSLCISDKGILIIAAVLSLIIIFKLHLNKRKFILSNNDSKYSLPLSSKQINI